MSTPPPRHLISVPINKQLIDVCNKSGIYDTNITTNTIETIYRVLINVRELEDKYGTELQNTQLANSFTPSIAHSYYYPWIENEDVAYDLTLGMWIRNISELEQTTHSSLSNNLQSLLSAIKPIHYASIFTILDPSGLLQHIVYNYGNYYDEAYFYIAKTAIFLNDFNTFKQILKTKIYCATHSQSHWNILFYGSWARSRSSRRNTLGYDLMLLSVECENVECFKYLTKAYYEFLGKTKRTNKLINYEIKQIINTIRLRSPTIQHQFMKILLRCDDDYKLAETNKHSINTLVNNILSLQSSVLIHDPNVQLAPQQHGIRISPPTTITDNIVKQLLANNNYEYKFIKTNLSNNLHIVEYALDKKIQFNRDVCLEYFIRLKPKMDQDINKKIAMEIDGGVLYKGTPFIFHIINTGNIDLLQFIKSNTDPQTRNGKNESPLEYINRLIATKPRTPRIAKAKLGKMKELFH